MNLRTQIERAIIAAIVYADCFSQVTNYITSKNFCTPIHKKIFDAAAALYPLAPIDIITITRQINSTDPDNMETAVDLILLLDKVNLAQVNAQYWAILLLQLDITEKFKKELVEWKGKRDHSGDAIEAAAITEIIQNIDSPGIDILRLIEKSIAYFIKLNMEPEIQAANQFNTNIALKVAEMKANAALISSLKAMQRLAGCSREVAYECNQFAIAITDMMLSNQVRPQYTQAAKLLN